MAVLYVLVLLLTVCLNAFLIKWHWSRRKLYQIAAKLPGPFAFPIIGSAWKLACKNEYIFEKICTFIRSHPHPMKLWIGTKLVIVFSDLNHIKKIMSSNKILNKSDFYDPLTDYVGCGLITGAGPKWKEHRKLLLPLLNLKFICSNIDTMQNQANILMDNLEKYIDIGTFNIIPDIHHCFLDIIGEIILGTEFKTQLNMNLEFSKAMEDVYENCYEQIMKPWLKNDYIFNLSSCKSERDRLKRILNICAAKAMEDSFDRINTNTVCDKSPIIDKISKMIKEDKVMSNQEFKNHLLTLFAASEDTTSITASTACVCFGMYTEYQDLAAQEIYNVFGGTHRNITYEDLSKLPYLEMCIQDVLRLATIAPFIVRKCTEDFHVGELLIPPGCDILIPIFEIHRDPMQWENPEHFFPNHFLPEAVEKRNIYAYLPFSIGPRGCIGKYLAIQSIKLVMANLLQRFTFEADGKFPDIRLKSDISVRPIYGYNVKLGRRVWK